MHPYNKVTFWGKSSFGVGDLTVKDAFASGEVMCDPPPGAPTFRANGRRDAQPAQSLVIGRKRFNHNSPVYVPDVPAVLHNVVVLYRRTLMFSYIVSTNQSPGCTSLANGTLAKLEVGGFEIRNIVLIVTAYSPRTPGSAMGFVGVVGGEVAFNSGAGAGAGSGSAGEGSAARLGEVSVGARVKVGPLLDYALLATVINHFIKVQCNSRKNEGSKVCT